MIWINASNECEGEERWSQNRTLTVRFSFSNEYRFQILIISLSLWQTESVSALMKPSVDPRCTVCLCMWSCKNNLNQLFFILNLYIVEISVISVFLIHLRRHDVISLTCCHDTDVCNFDTTPWKCLLMNITWRQDAPFPDCEQRSAE